MKKYLFLFLLLCFPFGVKAYCDVTNTPRLQKIANNLTFSYDYIEKDDGVTFNVTFYNMNKYLYIVDINNKMTYKFNNNNSISINGYKDGTKIEYRIYADAMCKDEYLKTIYINLPTYNKYYTDELCKGIESYKYCNKWVSATFTYYDFNQAIKAYKESLIEDEPIITEDTKVSILDEIISFYIKYYIYILPSIIIIFILVIVYLKNKDNFDLKVRDYKERGK